MSNSIKDDIRQAVNAGRTATVSEREVTIGGWHGVGYVLQDTQTGGAAYKISGGANGGYLKVVLVITLIVIAIFAAYLLFAAGIVSILGVFVAGLAGLLNYATLLSKIRAADNESEFNQALASSALAAITGVIFAALNYNFFDILVRFGSLNQLLPLTLWISISSMFLKMF